MRLRDFAVELIEKVREFSDAILFFNVKLQFSCSLVTVVGYLPVTIVFFLENGSENCNCFFRLLFGRISGRSLVAVWSQFFF